ncbi:MAG: HEAT repeat domain-containing protein [Myxococcota bacterium]
MGSVLFRLLPEVRRQERPRFLFFLSLFFLVSAAETVGLAGSESLFLAKLGPERLPVAFVVASLVAVLGSLVYSTVVGTFRNDQLFAIMLLSGAAILLVVGPAAGQGQVWAFLALFCLFWLSRAVFLIHYWTFTGDHFDTLSSKRLFPLFAIGASLGGVAGGLLAAGVGGLLAAEWLVAVWALLLLAAAGLLLLNSARLRRWIPLESMESDDTSVERLRGAARYLSGTPLGRWMIASSLGMVVALFIAQFAYSEIFSEAFPDAGQLALFFGLFLAGGNLLEIAVATAVSRWLIPRFGVPTANLIHPLLTVATFAGLAWSPSVPMAVGARLDREALENSLASPVRNLAYNALPLRYRGRVRGFLEGIVANTGMGAAGLLLLALGSQLSWGVVCSVGGGAAALYGLANLRVRREYLHALVEELRAGRLAPSEIEREIGSGEAEPMAEIWTSLVGDESRGGGRPPLRLLSQLARVLARHGFGDRLLAALDHPEAGVRRAALEALAAAGAPERETGLALALRDSDPEVRLAALAGVRESGAAPGPRLGAELHRCLDHTDPRIRASAAAALGAEGGPLLDEMLGAAQPILAAAALGVLPEARIEQAVVHCVDPEPTVRAAALERVARADGLPDGWRGPARAALRDPHPQVRAAGLVALAGHPDPADADVLVAGICDPSREVRLHARQALAGLGDAGLVHARRLVASDRSGEVEAALGVLVGLGTPDALEVLEGEFRSRLHRAWEALLALHALPSDPALPVRFMGRALADAFGRHVRVALAVLERSEAPGVVRTLEKNLRFSSSRVRADALEVLSLLGDREGARLLVALLEEGPLEERSAVARSLVPEARSLDDVLQVASRFGRFTRAAAAALGDGDTSMEVPMERLLLLTQVPLFAQMSLEQIEAIDALMTEVQYMDRELIVREGDTGDELFVILEGRVEFYKESGGGERLQLSTAGPGSYLGEMAILSHEPRSATAISAGPTRLLSLRGDQLRELVLDMPEISFELLRELTARVKSAERRLAEIGG